jgi:release factor glutamine methyltransferase
MPAGESAVTDRSPRLIRADQTASPAALLVQDANALAAALGLSSRDARAEAELLLTRALGISKARLIAHPELAAEARSSSVYVRYLERRLGGEPVAYILGEREFYGLDFHVTADVLIPRPETELLVELALARIPEDEPRTILDIGTGSGCIGVTLARLRPRSRVIATDISSAALEVAGRNARRHALANVELRLGDGLAPVLHERFDVIVSNPPYVAASDPHLQSGDLRFEPKHALTPGADGLGCLRTIIAHAPAHLVANGWLLLEHGYDQGEAVAALLADAGLGGVFTAQDLAGLPRVGGGCATGPA